MALAPALTGVEYSALSTVATAKVRHFSMSARIVFCSWHDQVGDSSDW